MGDIDIPLPPAIMFASATDLERFALTDDNRRLRDELESSRITANTAAGVISCLVKMLLDLGVGDGQEITVPDSVRTAVYGSSVSVGEGRDGTGRVKLNLRPTEKPVEVIGA